MYQDELVSILKPDVKKGVIVMTRFNQPENMESLCVLGLKTGAQLQKEGMDFGRRVKQPHIILRGTGKTAGQLGEE